MKRLVTVTVFGCVFLVSGLVLSEDRQKHRGDGGKSDRGGVSSAPQHRGGAVRERISNIPERNKTEKLSPGKKSDNSRPQKPSVDGKVGGKKDAGPKPTPMPKDKAQVNHLSHEESWQRHHRSRDGWHRMGWGFSVGTGGFGFYYGSVIDGCYPCYYPRAVFYPRVWVVDECYDYWYGCPLYPGGCPVHGYHHREGYCRWRYDSFGGMDFYYYPVRPEVELEIEIR